MENNTTLSMFRDGVQYVLHLTKGQAKNEFTYKGYTYIVHKPVRYDICKNGFSFYGGNCFIVSEVSTGFTFPSVPMSTIKDTKQVAMERLEKLPEETVRNVIEKTREKIKENKKVNCLWDAENKIFMIGESQC